MISQLDGGWSIVIPGYWNRMIFRPDWVARELYGGEQVETLVSLVPAAPTIYRDDWTELRVSSNKLEVRACQDTDEAVGRIEALACKILESLMLTPVQAVGINFAYHEDTPSVQLLEMFSWSDDADIEGRDWDIADRVILRSLKKGDCTLNLQYKLSSDVVRVDFNFHYDVNTAAQALDILRSQVLARRQEGLDLVASPLSLQLEEGRAHAE